VGGQVKKKAFTREKGSAELRALRALPPRLLTAAILLAFGLFSGACVRVKPWQRGVLAKPCMSITPDPGEAQLEEHFFSYREGSAGGYGGTGGGCGCN